MEYALQRVEQPGKHGDIDIRALQTVDTCRRDHHPGSNRSTEKRGNPQENWRTKIISRWIEALWRAETNRAS
jgi:hypothetical protein